MKFNKISMREEKGQVGGVTILIGTVSALFIIGFLVMIYALVGGALLDSGVLYTSATGSVVNESIVWVGAGVVTIANEGAFEFTGWNASAVLNGSTMAGDNETLVEGVDYSIQSSAGTISNLTTDSSDGVRITYTYSYSATTTASGVLNETIDALSSVITWFSIIIIITVMVVLILLTTLIIRAIRGTGFAEGESA